MKTVSAINLHNIKKSFKSLQFEQKAIIAILFIFLLRGLFYLTVFPLWYAPDEPHHFLNIAHLAKSIAPRLVQRSSLNGVPKAWYPLQSLYYWFCLPFYLLLAKTSTAAQAYTLRFVSVILSSLVILLGYKTAKEVFPKNNLVVIGTPVLISFLPMFTHISAAINNDNLANLLLALFLWLAARSLNKTITLTSALGLIITVVLGFLVKRTTLFAAPLLLLLPILMLFRGKSDTVQKTRIRSVFMITVLIGSGLLILAIKQFGLVDISNLYGGFNRYFQNPSWPASMNRNLQLFWMTFWADFGWADVPVDLTYYQALKFICLIPIAGLLMIFAKNRGADTEKLSKAQVASLIFLLASIVIAFTTNFAYVELIYNTLYAPYEKQWTALQGRHLFTVITSFALLFVLGLSGLIKSKHRTMVLLNLTGISFAFDFVCLFKYIIPHYYETFNFSEIVVISHYTTQRPALLNNSFLYSSLFLIYIALFLSFCYWVYKEGEKTKEEISTNADDG